MKTRVEQLTPNIAAKYLEKNTNNRTISQSLVDRYASDMSAGHWGLTHQGIAFDEDGNLLDGQHRCLAVIKSGVTVQILVTRELPTVVSSNGIDLFTRDLCDGGKNRSLANHLQISHGYANSNSVSGAVSNISFICTNTTSATVTTAQALHILEIYNEHIEFAVNRLRSCKLVRRIPIIGAVAFVRAANKAMVDEAAEFMVTGEGMQRGHPILTLRNWMINSRGIGASGTSQRSTLIDATFSALYHCLQKNELRMIKSNNIAWDYFVKQQRTNVQRVREILNTKSAS